MAEEIGETEVVEVTRTVVAGDAAAMTAEAAAAEMPAAPVYEETVVESTTVTTEATPMDTAPVVYYYPPRGPWDFTDAQRIIIGVLLWLNILVAFTGYMAITGRLSS